MADRLKPGGRQLVQIRGATGGGVYLAAVVAMKKMMMILTGRLISQALSRQGHRNQQAGRRHLLHSAVNGGNTQSLDRSARQRASFGGAQGPPGLLKHLFGAGWGLGAGPDAGGRRLPSRAGSTPLPACGGRHLFSALRFCPLFGGNQRGGGLPDAGRSATARDRADAVDGQARQRSAPGIVAGAGLG